MARTARIVAPGMAHHVTQRGNRKMETFLCEDDYGVYLGLMKTWCDRHRVRIQAYCLMPNHVHLIAVPETLEGLSRGIGEAHRRYTRHINFREGWRGDWILCLDMSTFSQTNASAIEVEVFANRHPLGTVNLASSDVAQFRLVGTVSEGRLDPRSAGGLGPSHGQDARL